MERRLILRKLEVLIQRAMEKNNHTKLQMFLFLPLFCLARIYLSFGRWREIAYQHGLRPVDKLPCRVICVGNLTLGGTGKTPIVELIGQTLLRRGERVGIISRGYGSRTGRAFHGSGSRVLVVSNGKEILASVCEAGDEPVMLAKRMQGIPVLTGKRRYQVGKKAIENFQLETLIMDDGFQHLQLKRDLNIVVLDGRNPFGNGYGFPAGKLRESPGALRRADMIVLTKVMEGEKRERTLQLVRRITPSVPIVIGQHKPRDLTSLQGDQTLPLEALQGKPVMALSGIGDPSYFLSMLKELGAIVISHRMFPDHHWFSAAEIQRLEQQSLSANVWGIITTEKDAVRLTYRPHCPVWVLRIDMVIVEGKDIWGKKLALHKNV